MFNKLSFKIVKGKKVNLMRILESFLMKRIFKEIVAPSKYKKVFIENLK